ncbi:hypothetical protein D6C94_06228 [Aureobasidium pullulans]|uniref:Myb-like domain-containing protein n=1 Tax=Aureobasidium pullulans TaxID=5580 RepID=A0AB38LTQ9_AURPU|nr:hypothetical protein D6C94_06228 [Aureobasidium pullulans]
MAFDGFHRARSSSRDDRIDYDPDEYQRGRQRIDLKLKGTFERIFEKYAKDFTGVGDEIDMETGEVVVNNGHLTHEQQYHNTSVVPSTEVAHSLPQISIADSLNQLVPHQDAEGRVDPEAIHQLGQSIANQIADFLMRATSLNRQPHFPGQPQGIWSAPALPEDAFNPPNYLDNRANALTPAPHRAPSVWDSPSGGQSLWAPTASRPKKRRRLLKHTETSFDLDPALTDDATFSDAANSRNRVRQNRGYSREEDDLIKRLKEINGLTWQQITAHMPGRTMGGLSGRYTRVLKDLPRPVMIKREIIEIMDGEDDGLSTPGPSHTAASPGMSPFRTPLLRRAMDKQIARHGDNGEIPITIGDEGDDTDSQRDSSAPPPAELFSDGQGGHYRRHPITGVAAPTLYMSDTPEVATPEPVKNKRVPKEKYFPHGPAGFYRTFDTSDPKVGSFGMLRTDSPSTHVAQEHNLNFFGPTSGFGVLRMEQPKQSKKKKRRSSAKASNESEAPRRTSDERQYNQEKSDRRFNQSNPTTYTYPAPQLRDRLANTPTSTINLFARAEQYLRAKGLTAAGMTTSQLISSLQANQRANPTAARSSNTGSSTNMMPPPPARSRFEPVFEESSPVHPPHPPPPYSANPPLRASTPPRRTEPMVIDTENDGDISDSSATVDTPATATRYADSPVTTAHDGPYFLSNLPPPPSPFMPAPQAQMRMPSSSPLSSPPPAPSPAPSQSSSNESQRRSVRSSTRQATKKSLQPSESVRSAETSLPTPKPAIKNIALAATPKTPVVHYGTPLKETVGRKEMLRKRVLAEPDDGSEDELA